MKKNDFLHLGAVGSVCDRPSLSFVFGVVSESLVLD
jgi:hypothetical protein